MKISIKDLCSLKNAGYTVDDISALTEMGVLEDEEPTTISSHNPPFPEAEAPVVDGTTGVEVSDLEKENERLKEELAKIQTENRREEIPEVPEVDLVELFK